MTDQNAPKIYVIEFISGRRRVLACKHETQGRTITLHGKDGEQVAVFHHVTAWYVEESLATDQETAPN